MGADNVAEDGGSETSHDWTPEEDRMLLDFVIANYENEVKKPEVAAKTVKWQNVGIDGRTPDECQARWKILMGLVRNHRTMKEIAEAVKDAVNDPTAYKSLMKRDAKSHPDFPKTPPTAYLLFFMDMRKKLLAQNPDEKYTTPMLAKTIGKAYQEMTTKKRTRYEAMAAAAKEEHAEKLIQFYRDHPLYRKRENERKAVPSRPVTPFFMFLKSRLEDAEDYDEEEQVPADLKAELKEEFAQLPPKKKAKYVKKALAYEADYADQLAVCSAMQSGLIKRPALKQICTKEELKLMEKESRKPEKPPMTAYAAFAREQRESGVLDSLKSKEAMSEVASMWKKVNDCEKARYAMEAATAKTEYTRRMAEWEASVVERLRNPKQLTWDSVQTRGIYLYASETLTAYRKKCPTLYDAELRDLIVQDYRKLSEDKRKEYEDRVTVRASWWKKRRRDKTPLFKNEPLRVPRSGYELFVREYLSKEKGKKAMKDLKPMWNALSKADQESFEHRCDDLKKEYSKKFKEFVDGLSAVEMAEFKRVRGPDAPNGSPEREVPEAVEDVEASSPEDASPEGEEKDSDDEDEDEDEDDEDSPPALKYGVDQPKQLDEPSTSNGTANKKPSQQGKRKPSSHSSSLGEDDEAVKKLKNAAHPVASLPLQSPSKRKNSPSPSSSSDSDSEEEEQNVSKMKTEPVSQKKKKKKAKKESSDEFDSDSEDDGKLVPAARSVLDVSMMEGSKSSQSPLVKPSPKPTPNRKKQETDEESEPEPPKSPLKSSAKKGSTSGPAKPGPASSKKPTSARKGESSGEELPRKPTPAKPGPKPLSALAVSWRRTAEEKGSSSDDSDDEEPLPKSSLATKSSNRKALAPAAKSARKEDTDKEEEEEPPKSFEKSSRKQEKAREEPAVKGKAKKEKARKNVGPAEEVRVASEEEPTGKKKRKREQVVEEDNPVATKKNKRDKAITSTPMHVEDPKKKKKKKDKAGIAERN